MPIIQEFEKFKAVGLGERGAQGSPGLYDRCPFCLFFQDRVFSVALAVLELTEICLPLPPATCFALVFC